MSTPTLDAPEALTPRAMTTHEKEIVASLYLHRLFTTRQLHALVDPTSHVRCTQRRMNKLAQRGFVGRAQGPGPGREYRWWLTQRGAELAELGGDVEVRNFRMTADAATGRHADHLMAVNDIGLALVAAAGGHGDEFGYHHWRHEVAHRYARANNDVLSADAVVTYDLRTADGAVVSQRRFIEVDRGTESVHELAEKVYAYQLFARWEPPRRDGEGHLPRLAWRRVYHSFPAVVFVYVGLSPAQAKARSNDLAHFLGLDNRVVPGPTRVDVAATTLETLESNGPFASICELLPTQQIVPMFRRR